MGKLLISGLLDLVKPEFDSKFSTFGKIDLGFLMLFAQTPTLAEHFVAYNYPKSSQRGRDYGDTLLGTAKEINFYSINDFFI